MGNKELTTVERHGTEIRHLTAGTRGRIVGTYVMGKQAGFQVLVPKEKKILGLPFSNLKDWEKFLKEPKKRKK